MNLVSGLFRGHAIPSRQMDETLSRFADELALHNLATGDEGGNINACADRMGITRGTAAVLLRMLCERYGEAVSV